jgi:hypothetical protein
MLKCVVILLAIAPVVATHRATHTPSLSSRVRHLVGAVCISLPLSLHPLPVLAAPSTASEYYNRAEGAIEKTDGSFKGLDRSWSTAKRTIQDNEKVRVCYSWTNIDGDLQLHRYIIIKHSTSL